MNVGILRRKIMKAQSLDNLEHHVVSESEEEFLNSNNARKEDATTNPTAASTNGVSFSDFFSTSALLSHTNLFFRESLVLPLMMMYFVMLLINTLLRDTKDTMLVNSVAGVSAIPILKSWVTIPSSVSFFFAYSRLSHNKNLSSRTKFLIILFSFAFFFLFFALVIYPLRKQISPRIWAQSVRDERGTSSSLAVFASTMEEWTLGLFYIVCELWSSAVCQLLFWSVANDVMTIREAKASYPVIGAMGNAGLVVAGQLLLIFADRRDVDSARAYLNIIEHHTHYRQQRNTESTFAGNLTAATTATTTTTTTTGSSSSVLNDNLDPTETGWVGTLLFIAVLVTLSSIFIVFCYDDLYRRVDLYHHHPKEKAPPIEEKDDEVEMTTWEAIRFLWQSEPLQLVAILVSSYGVSSSLIEVTWKGQVKRAFATSGEYSRFMGSFWTWTGLSSMICMVLSSGMLRQFGYRVAVMFTPVAMLFAGGLFFMVALSVAASNITPELTTSLSVAAYAGALAVLVSKSAKYAVFDATKEMVFIPLDKESRSVGKAAIDVVAYRLSKSGGAFALQFVLVVFGNLEERPGLIPVGILFLFILVIWTRAAYATGKWVQKAQREENQTLRFSHEEV